MTPASREKLVTLVGAVMQADERAGPLRALAEELGVEAVLFFTEDSEVDSMLIAPGFPQTLPDGASWRNFVRDCLVQRRHAARLTFPVAGGQRAVTGLAWDKTAVLALIGGSTPEEEVLRELELLLPLLATAFQCEHEVGVHKAHIALATRMARESATLAQGLDNARRAAQQEITARKKAEQALQAVSAELTQTNAELVRARDKALAASSAKDKFLAALSHELRTPLNPVLLIASEAAQNAALTPAVRRDFEIIVQNVGLEARLIDDLLDLTRITRDKVVLEMEGVDLHCIVRDTLAIVKADLLEKEQVLTLGLHAERHTVTGDSVRLQQIVWNVLKNAVKFTPPGGKIGVETLEAPRPGAIAIKVTDSGIGLSEQERGGVFDAFSQGEHVGAGGSHRFGGLGLGLSISQRLVELHGGRITAESPGRGCGSTFTIELPLADAQAGESEAIHRGGEEKILRADEKGTLAERRRRILLVEDHAPTRLALAILLERRYFDVVATSTLAEARAASDVEAFDLLVSDIGLPDGEGYDLMVELRDRFDLKGIALTGYGMEEDIERSRRAGFVAHLTKPIDVQSLDHVLMQALGQGV